MLNLLLESERAGVLALEFLADRATAPALRRFLLAARDQESNNASDIERLIREAGGTVSGKTGPFFDKVTALGSLREQLDLMSRGQAWVARKAEQALAVAPERGPIRDYLKSMANRHRAEVEWGRAEVIRLMNAGG